MTFWAGFVTGALVSFAVWGGVCSMLLLWILYDDGAEKERSWTES